MRIEYANVILNDKIVETNMDDVENAIVMDYYNHNKPFMEKMGMQGGYKERAKSLSYKAKEVWKYTNLSEAELALYRVEEIYSI